MENLDYNNIDTTLVKLGTCPVCGKGEMVQGSIGYSCNYFRSLEDKCTFNIYKEYFQKEITPEIATQLITAGRTDIFDDFKNKAGDKFTARLIVADGRVHPDFVNEYLPEPCPVCGGKVEIFHTGYGCENYHETDAAGGRACPLFIRGVVCDRAITPDIAVTLLQGKKTAVLDGFTSPAKPEDDPTGTKKQFSARLYLDDNHMVKFDNELCKCPKCGGQIYIRDKAYNCSKYRDEAIKCSFVIWREMRGREITPDEAAQLCEKGRTETLHGFRGKEGEYSRQLILTPDFTVKMI